MPRKPLTMVNDVNDKSNMYIHKSETQLLNFENEISSFLHCSGSHIAKHLFVFFRNKEMT
jgi:hypothetical protein